MGNATMEHDHETQDMDLKISVKDGKTCEKILKIEVPQEAIAEEFNHFYAEISPKSKVPGFRPGKAPRNVLELHYSNEARQHVVEHLISHAYRQAIREKDIKPLGYPEVKDVKFDDKKLSFEALVETRPKIKLSKTSGFNVKKEKVELKADDVDQVLKRIQESQAQFRSVEDRPAQMGDVVVADYTCLVEGKELEKRNEDWFELQEKDYLEGFSKQLVGVKPGDEREVQAVFPKDFSKKDVAGKKAVFQVKVKEIKSKTLPEINDELAQTAGEFKTIAELRERIEKDTLATRERDAEAKYEKEILDELIKQNKLDLPEGLVKRRAEKLIENSTQQFTARGGNPEKAAEMKEKMAPEFDKEARRQIQVAFLLDELAEREKLEVTEEDLQARFKKLSEEVHQPLEVVEKYYKGNEEQLDALREQIRSEKAIQYLKDNAKK